MLSLSSLHHWFSLLFSLLSFICVNLFFSAYLLPLSFFFVMTGSLEKNHLFISTCSLSDFLFFFGLLLPGNCSVSQNSASFSVCVRLHVGLPSCDWTEVCHSLLLISCQPVKLYTPCSWHMSTTHTELWISSMSATSWTVFFLCLLPTLPIMPSIQIAMSPQLFNGFKVQGLGWPLPDLNFVCLEPRCCSLTGVFRVGVLLKHPFQWHCLFSIRQHDLFKYSDRSKLFLYPWYAIIRPDSMIRRNSLISWCFHHHASRSSQFTVAWIQCLEVVWQTFSELFFVFSHFQSTF